MPNLGTIESKSCLNREKPSIFTTESLITGWSQDSVIEKSEILSSKQNFSTWETLFVKQFKLVSAILKRK